MAKSDKKIHEQRMSGAVWAWDYIKREGMEAFEKQLKFRNATFIPLEIDEEKVKCILDMITTRIYNSYVTCVYKVLNEDFNFGEKRLKHFRDRFNETCKDVTMVDGYGERLYSFYDYASELNAKYNLDINLDKVEEVDNINLRSMDTRANVHDIELLLHDHGYGEAAAFLVQYLGGSYEGDKKT